MDPIALAHALSSLDTAVNVEDGGQEKGQRSCCVRSWEATVAAGREAKSDHFPGCSW